MASGLPTSGDPARDAVIAEISELNAAVHARTLEFVGPMPLPPDLTMQQLRVLMAIGRQPGLSVHQLAKVLGVSTPTASGLVDRLADKDLLEKVDDEADRRVRHLHLTAEGLATINVLDSMFDRAMRQLVSLFTYDELVSFRDNAVLMLDVLGRARQREQPATDAG